MYIRIEGCAWYRSRQSMQQQHTLSFNRGRRPARGWKSGKNALPLAVVLHVTYFWKTWRYIANKPVFCAHPPDLYCMTIMAQATALSMNNPSKSIYCRMAINCFLATQVSHSSAMRALAPFSLLHHEVANYTPSKTPTPMTALSRNWM